MKNDNVDNSDYYNNDNDKENDDEMIKDKTISKYQKSLAYLII